MGIQAWQPRVAPLNDGQMSEVPTQVPTQVQTQVQNLPTDVAPANDAVQRAITEVVQPVDVPVAEAPAAKRSPVREAASAPPFMGEEEPPMPTDDNMPDLDMLESELSSFPDAAPVIDVSTLGWPELQSTVSACTACELHQSRTQTVFGAGNHTADWMIIGEAPKVDEDQQGKPFVGDSGELLNNMLRALGLKREQVFVSNILKCQPADDRDPRPEEISQCEVYLQRQIALVAPKVIIAMGGVAAHGLLKVKTPVTKLRGQLHHYGEAPLVVTYHPAYLLRKPSEKPKSWSDLKFAASVVSGEQP